MIKPVIRLFPAGILAVALLFSCNTTPVFEDIYTFPNQSWQRIEEDIRFEVEITDADRRYNIDLPIRYDRNYPHQFLEVGINIQAPSGQESVLERKIYLVDENLQPRGTETDDAKDYVFRLFDDYKFNESGTYYIEMQNLTGNQMFLKGLHHIGMSISRAKKQSRE